MHNELGILKIAAILLASSVSAQRTMCTMDRNIEGCCNTVGISHECTENNVRNELGILKVAATLLASPVSA